MKIALVASELEAPAALFTAFSTKYATLTAIIMQSVLDRLLLELQSRHGQNNMHPQQQHQGNASNAQLQAYAVNGGGGGCSVNGDHAPHLDQPWLVSSASQLAQDSIVMESFRIYLLAVAPFPGGGASRASKIAWLRNFGKLYIRSARTMYNGPVVSIKMAAAELLRHAPEKLTLKLYCSTSDLYEISYVDEDVFRQGFIMYGRTDYTDEELCIEAFCHWLVSNNERDATVFFGSMECSKTDNITTKIEQMIDAFGLEFSYNSEAMLLHDAELRRPFTSTYCTWCLNPKMGENLYFSTADDDATASVHIVVRFHRPTAMDIANIAWENTLRGVASSTAANDVPSTYMLVEKPELTAAIAKNEEANNDEDELHTAETCHVLWLQDPHFDELARMRQDLLEGEGESFDIKSRLSRELCMDSGNLTLAIFEAEFKHIKLNRGWSKRFSSTLALTIAATDSVNWMCNNGCSPDVGARELLAYQTSQADRHRTRTGTSE
jgi:hypothetical protein